MTRPADRRIMGLFLLLTGFAASALAQPRPDTAIDPRLLAGLELRSIGPAAVGGRVAAIEGVPSDPDVLYVGAATGGVWKTVDAGLTWEPIFDDQPVAAIGAIAVHPTSPEIVWVGTGEGNPRNSASVGNGVYRSLDGGATWSHVGLEGTERISRIVLDPTDPDVAYVGAMGPTWGDSPERGVFKTSDGGKTWKKVLYVDQTTGAADLVMAPDNPRKLFAALWDHRRWPWFFRSGGPGSGLWVSNDGGESWQRRTPDDGLPEGELGRIGLAVAPSDPQVVYALVEAEGDENLFLRSDDGGRTFRRRAGSLDQSVGNRPFYYADLRVDPQDADRIYSLWSLISVSDDGGEHWRVLVPFREVHPDHHALWIDPSDPRRLVNGNDGGVYASYDRGSHWRFIRALPLAQYYHVRVDDDVPYHVFGGLQDNGSWRGPSEVWENGSIRNQHWQEVFFGDGFDTVPDPTDSMQGWAMSQEGHLARWNLRTGERRSVRPAPDYCTASQSGEGGEGGEAEACAELRFNWNAGIAIDPFDPATLYFGSQFVHKSTDRGESWTVISPDLTTDNPEWQHQAESGGLTLDVTGAENFTTIVAIAPSGLEKDLLWVGTDDGRLHVTRDGGATWTSVEGNLRGVPANTWVPHIEPSRHDPAEAFVVFDDHRRSNWTPYVFRTRDYGRTWTNLATPELRGYALAVAQDPVDRDLLFLGTEFGLWVSLDGGGHWLPWTHGVPTVSVMDLAIQEREDDLVVATHGRGLFILDDLSPLRELTAEVLREPLHLFPVSPAQQYRVRQTPGTRFAGHDEFRGTNEPYGALITVALDDETLPWPEAKDERVRQEALRAESPKSATTDEPTAEPGETGEESAKKKADEAKPKAKIEIRDAAGELLRSFEKPVSRGIDRIVWDLRRDAFKSPPSEEEEEEGGDGDRGPEVPPGSYTVTVRFGDHEASAPVEVIADPRFELSPEARQQRWQAMLRAGALADRTVAAIERLQRVQKDVAAILERVSDETPEGAEAGAKSPRAMLAEVASPVRRRAEALEKRLWQGEHVKGIPPETDVWSAVGKATWLLSSAWDVPTEAEVAYLERAQTRLDAVLPEIDGFFAEDVAELRRRVREAAVELLPEDAPLGGASAERMPAEDPPKQGAGGG